MGSDIHYFEQILLLKDAIRDKGDELHQLQLDIVSQIHAIEKDVLTLRETQRNINTRLDDLIALLEKTTLKFEAADTNLRESQERHILTLVELATKLGQTINIHQSNKASTEIDTIEQVNGDVVGGDKRDEV